MQGRALPLLLVLVGACGGGDEGRPDSFPGLVRVSGPSPFVPGCNGAPQRGVSFPGSAVEPFVAVDPANAAHLIGVWQQDRWSNGGANGLLAAASFDAGRTWTTSSAHFSRCTGGTAQNGGDYERASDPWVSISPDGTAHQIALVFNVSDGGVARAILASRSTDGGRTWSEPLALRRDADLDVAVDKGSITADPADPQLAYAVWDRLTGRRMPNSPALTGPAWFARTIDRGGSWQPARPIYDPGADAQTISNQIVALPDGAIVNLFVVLTRASTDSPDAHLAAMRSVDKGTSWSQPVVFNQCRFKGVRDPKTARGIRSGEFVPSFAADPVRGTLYAAWQDTRFTAGATDGIVLSRSVDGGLTWSEPVPVNQAREVQAFRPAVAVAKDGMIAVTYYDFRGDDPVDLSATRATAWLATSADGVNWRETQLGGPFDLRAAPSAPGYFLGDYEGLAAAGSTFVPFFALTSGGTSGVFVQPIGASTTQSFAAARSSW